MTFDTNPPSLIKLGDLKTCRTGAKLVVHGDYVYIFGGYNGNSGSLNMAEKMKIGEWVWSNLPNMKEARWDFGVYVSESRIYLIGGGKSTSIEYYDIDTNNFYLLPDIQVPLEGIVCAEIDDLIYTLGKQHLRVFNKEFQLIRSREYINNTLPHCYSDVIVRGSNFIFLRSNTASKVYSFDSVSMSISKLKSY